ncbi:recombinase family protein [Gemella sp. zg-570]|uniref:recombinase family protein n=1 Tax=Gemella sp. zg-570 TaxID=2840371 RepID=UPI001C0AE698|nr:recombinase family protein [Gemella sp. zg-570]QWQ38637.1 recombinase family protein [Gemella sp. zg-570]
MVNKKVTTIPATINPYHFKPINDVKKRKVAGYARVSTDSDEQQTSYETQVAYYTNYIKGRDDWEFVNVYTDEGISATTTRKREGFNKMIEDALNGEIDLIVTKSVSRFARNTVDSLSTIRKLKENGTEVYFEKESIWTFDSKGELLITIMSSLAQEESRSISENVTWGKRKRMADGKVTIPYSRVLGFEKGKEGNILVNHEQAEIVRQIFGLFLQGMTPHSIAVYLTKKEIKSPGGKDRWNQGTIRRMLSNEKYKGDALLQKEFTVDYLSKKKKKNEGEVPQYYVEGNHEAIISPPVFDLVQEELKKRCVKKSTRYSGVSIFSNKVKCAECGNWFGAKVWHSTSLYKKKIYQCNHKFKGSKKCRTPHLTEDEIKLYFIKAINSLTADREEVIENIKLVQETLCNMGHLKVEKQELHNELEALVVQIQEMIDRNARVVQNQESYQVQYNQLIMSYNLKKERYDELEILMTKRKAKFEKLTVFIQNLEQIDDIIKDFDASMWGSLVEYLEVDRDKKVIVVFKYGTQIKIEN